MEKIIDVNGKSIKFVSNGATATLYRQKFGKDLFAVMQKVGEDSTNGGIISNFDDLINAAYIMAKQGDPDITDDVIEWLSQFEMFDMHLAMPKLIELWGMNNLTLATSKKKSGRQSGR